VDYRAELSTPEGRLVNLSLLLPLHWVVFSTCSRAEFSIVRDGEVVEAGSARAHVEKNWGDTFPTGWVWLQGFSAVTDHQGEERSFCLAGGKILAQKAFLLGYRGAKVSWNFAPPWTLMPFSASTPWMKEYVDSKMGVARFEAGNWRRRLLVEVEATPEHEGWLGMCCPLSGGHGNTYAYETFEGSVKVSAYQRDWGMGWTLVEETVFENAAVEFGGGYSFKVSKQG
jgi:tocopherol cyclase